MAITWTIENLDVETIGSDEDVVKTVHFLITENKNEKWPKGDEIKICYYRHFVEIGEHDSSAFIAYSNLSEEEIITWVKNTLGTKHTEFLENLVTEGYENNPEARSTMVWGVYDPKEQKPLPFISQSLDKVLDVIEEGVDPAEEAEARILAEEAKDKEEEEEGIVVQEEVASAAILSEESEVSD